MIRFLSFWLIILFSPVFMSASAQSLFPINEDSVNTKMSNYDKAKGGAPLFVHFDKNIYAANENVWFTAYFLKDVYSENRKQSFILVVLIDNHNLIKIREKFIMIAGVSSGNILLPDSLKSGSYTFMVYYGESINREPVNAFVQPVTIKKPSADYFKASLIPAAPGESLKEGSKNVQLIINSRGENLVGDIPVYYYIGNPVNPVFSGRLKTNKNGQCQVSVPAKYLTNDNHTLQLEITFANEIRQLKYAFPGFANLISAKFYPEGGSLVEGLINNVGWEVKDETGTPVKSTGVIYKNGQPIDTIVTNSYGMGRFNFIPEINNSYFVKLPYSDDKNAEYKLPGIAVNRPVIIVPSAIVNDTLSLFVRNRKAANFYVLIHNYKQLFFSFSVRVDSAGRFIKIALTDLPRGIAEITLLDSLKKPCVERLFFAHYDLNHQLNISVNQSTYKIRKKVLLNIQLKNQSDKPITGLVSIACVQTNKVSPANFKRIDSYVYLLNELGNLPFKENYLGASVDDKVFLEDLLLIKGWRNYSWTDLSHITAADSVLNKDAPVLTGEVTRTNKPLKKAVSVIVMKGVSLTSIETTATGKFSLGIDDLLVDGKQLRLFVSGPHPEDYKINITDPSQTVIDSLSAGLISSSAIIQNKEYSTPSDETRFGGTISLGEVKITSRDNSFYGSSKKQNPCGDYVCLYGFLNCPLHVGDSENKSPVKGKIYKSYLGAGGDGQEIFTQTVYTGCEIKKNDYAKVIDGILYPVEFYAADYEKDSVAAPQFISTIYWKNIYQLPIAGGKPLEFYTGDITGEFKIIVQGITDDDVIYGQQTFKVSE